MAEGGNIAAVLCAQARKTSDEVALLETRGARLRSVTFAQLEGLSARTAAHLMRWGLKRGDAALVFVPMSVELYAALIALFRIGAIGVFLDPSAGKDHIERCLALYPPQAFIGTPKAHLLRLTCPALRRIPVQVVTGGWFPGTHTLMLRSRRADSVSPYVARPALQEQTHHGQNATQTIAPVAGDTPALITFTSGSTGQPKAAVRTHGFLLEQHRVLQRSLDLNEQDVVLSTLPVFVLCHLGSGVTSLLPDADLRRVGAINPLPVLDQIQRHQATVIEASPAFLECLLKANRPMRSIRKVFTGGAPVFARLLKAFQAQAPNAQLLAVYGSTEAEPICEIAYDRMSQQDLGAMRAGAGLLAGKPIEDIALRILQDRWGFPIGPFTSNEFMASCLPCGEIGEIVVSGAHVLQGYLRGQGDAETKFKVDGVIWHRTGDAGYLDEQGRVWLLGRCAARIQDQGGVLYPFAVECALSDYSGVCRSALVAHRGARVLVVERSPEAGVRAAHDLKAQLAWAGVDEVVFERVPVDKRHNAKVDYPALFELLDGVRRDASAG